MSSANDAGHQPEVDTDRLAISGRLTITDHLLDLGRSANPVLAQSAAQTLTALEDFLGHLSRDLLPTLETADPDAADRLRRELTFSILGDPAHELDRMTVQPIIDHIKAGQPTPPAMVNQYEQLLLESSGDFGFELVEAVLRRAASNGSHDDIASGKKVIDIVTRGFSGPDGVDAGEAFDLLEHFDEVLIGDAASTDHLAASVRELHIYILERMAIMSQSLNEAFRPAGVDASARARVMRIELDDPTTIEAAPQYERNTTLVEALTALERNRFLDRPRAESTITAALAKGVDSVATAIDELPWDFGGIDLYDTIGATAIRLLEPNASITVLRRIEQRFRQPRELDGTPRTSAQIQAEARNLKRLSVIEEQRNVAGSSDSLQHFRSVAASNRAENLLDRNALEAEYGAVSIGIG